METNTGNETLHHASAAQWGRSVFIASLPVFACFLGGSTMKWAEGLIVALLGAFLIFQPPRRSLGWLINATFIAFALCALISYLPQSWFLTPAWRKTLTGEFGIALSNSVTPQPWLTAGCFASLIAALCWLYRVSAQELELRVARFQLRLFAVGIVLLGALSIFLYLTNNPLSFWQSPRGFGPFQDRNQTADLFGVTSVLILASAQDDIRHRRMGWLLWTIAFVVVIAAIVLNSSRAGVVILVAASAIWIAVVAVRVGSAARIGLVASFVLLLFSILLIRGGETLERFHLQKFAGGDFAFDLRWRGFPDVWHLVRSSPWTGIGLANFEPVFAIFRETAGGNTRPLHLESDWLWAWAELGCVGVALILLGTILLIRRVWPLQIGTNQRFRIAALIGALVFGLHGLVNLSAHRVGTAYSAIFLLGLSLHRPTQLRLSKAIPWIFRILGVVLIAVGVSWALAWRTMAMQPGAVGVRNAKQLAADASRGRNFSEAMNLCTRAVDWAPLDWELYYFRATAEIAQGLAPQLALEDFRRARFLEPTSYSVPLEEGFVWLGLRPEFAASAWAEALRRGGADRHHVFRSIIFTASLRDPRAREIIEQLAFREPNLALEYLAQLPATEFHGALTKFLQPDPDLAALKPEEKRQLFHLWRERGGLASLLALIDRHPDWLPLAWRAVASSRAAIGDFQGACSLMQTYGSDAVFPPMQSGQSIEQLQTRAYQGMNNFDVGFTLCREQMDRGRTDDALATARHFADNPASPAYFHLLEAQAWAAKQNWQRSWTAWVAFEKANGKAR
jgi:O-antigen ligase